ncbi:MAG: putative Myosin-H heavy chain, partial [Streblomastix strix]
MFKKAELVPAAEADRDPVWKQVALIGTELNILQRVEKSRWFFTHLERELDTGVLAEGTVWIFGSTEALTLPPNFSAIHLVPVIFAIKSDLQPIHEVRITSVQMNKEQALPLNALKLDWVPFVNPSGNPARAAKDLFLLTCNLRRAANKKLTEDKVNEYTYAVPYIYNPFKNKDEEEDTTCMIPVEVGGQIHPFEFDWKNGDRNQTIDDIISDNDLQENKREEIKNMRLESQKLLNSQMLKKNALTHLKVYKFYPSNWKGSTSPFINRFFGKADVVVQPLGIDHVTFPSAEIGTFADEDKDREVDKEKEAPKPRGRGGRRNNPALNEPDKTNDYIGEAELIFGKEKDKGIEKKKLLKKKIKRMK